MYRSLEAQLHDAFWAAEGPPAELPLLREFLTQFPGPSLELGCGSGRLMAPLAKDGFEVEGLDNSPEMIALGQTHLPDLTFHLGDLASFQPTKTYRSFTLPAFTLQLLPQPQDILQHLHQMLPPDGALYLTTFVPWAELNGDLPEEITYLDHEITLPNGHQAILSTKHQLDREQQILHRFHEYEIPRQNLSHRSEQTLAYFFAGELEALLEKSGFTIAKTIPDFDLMASPSEEEPDILTHFAVKSAKTPA